jgi:hypothetical protein
MAVIPTIGFSVVSAFETAFEMASTDSSIMRKKSDDKNGGKNIHHHHVRL